LISVGSQPYHEGSARYVDDPDRRSVAVRMRSGAGLDRLARDSARRTHSLDLVDRRRHGLVTTEQSTANRREVVSASLTLGVALPAPLVRLLS